MRPHSLMSVLLDVVMFEQMMVLGQGNLGAHAEMSSFRTLAWPRRGQAAVRPAVNVKSTQFHGNVLGVLAIMQITSAAVAMFAKNNLVVVSVVSPLLFVTAMSGNGARLIQFRNGNWTN